MRQTDWYNHKILWRAARLQESRIGDLCKQIGISRTHFYHIITGKRNPSPQKLRQVCDGLGVPISEVINVNAIGV